MFSTQCTGGWCNWEICNVCKGKARGGTGLSAKIVAKPLSCLLATIVLLIWQIYFGSFFFILDPNPKPKPIHVWFVVGFLQYFLVLLNSHNYDSSLLSPPFWVFLLLKHSTFLDWYQEHVRCYRNKEKLWYFFTLDVWCSYYCSHFSPFNLAVAGPQ